MFFRIFSFFGCCILLLTFAPVIHAQDIETTAALEVTAAINGYRMENQLPPLNISPVLQEMARVQAEYVMSLPDIPDGGDIHIGANGEMPAVRAITDPFHWETYGADHKIIIGENAGIGDVNFVMNFWKNSSIHNNTILNPNYREIGVWSLLHEYGHLFIVVFGSRPNELPILVNPMTQELYFSNEYYAHSNSAWLKQIQSIRLFDANGKPISETIPWQTSLPLPANVSQTIYVLLNDGQTQVIQEVNLTEDIALLPDTLSIVLGEPVQVAAETQLVAEQPIQPQTVSTTSTGPDAILLYDDRTLTLINVTDHRIDISDLVLEGSGQVLPGQAWAEVTPMYLNDFLQGGCIQVWSWDEPHRLPEPSSCDVRISFIFMNPDALFWTQDNFNVKLGDKVIATCPPSTGLCNLYLSR